MFEVRAGDARYTAGLVSAGIHAERHAPRRLRAAGSGALAAHARPQPLAPVEPPVRFTDTELSYLANVSNDKARAFYRKHGVELIADAYELNREEGEVSLMITKHCLRYSHNLCPKELKEYDLRGMVKAEPMTLMNGKRQAHVAFRLQEMRNARRGEHPQVGAEGAGDTGHLPSQRAGRREGDAQRALKFRSRMPQRIRTPRGSSRVRMKTVQPLACRSNHEPETELPFLPRPDGRACVFAPRWRTARTGHLLCLPGHLVRHAREPAAVAGVGQRPVQAAARTP
jgi:hypothetical protein